MMEEKQNLISAAAAAKQLNVSRATLSRLVRDGRLGTYRIGHRTMFDQRILEEFKTAAYEPPRDGASAPSA
jgi:excisionase family DNA binding protein